ncbi:MAG: trehalose-phosphatase [Omnitrophica bacterium RIFCSPLOWO2_12_FULL_50_11]|nr:MAG: trehalose-phosphatase [Omnitrophica bacterium RIFCSPLOWO2_12_FULL_50_11]
MKHVLSNWPEIQGFLEGHYLFLCLDYDGTLIRIVRNPGSANLSRTNCRTLQALSKAKEVKTALVSGRSLSDLKGRVGLANLIYVGNHGLECEGPNIHFTHSQAQVLSRLLRHVAEQLKAELQNYRGVVVENKELTLSVHFRKLDPQKVGDALTVFDSVLDSYVRTSQLATTVGKKVWEVRPAVKWNKGTVVRWLMGRLEDHLARSVYPIYVGDDRTDEDAFRAIKHKGLGIKVVEDQNISSQATHCLYSVREVYAFLKRLILIRDGSPQRLNRLQVARKPSL